MINVNDRLDYCPETGKFFWKVNAGGTARVGSMAGAMQSKGYIILTVDGTRVLAHRLAWNLCYGKIKKGFQIDHINGDRTDNRISNLRCVDGCTNQQNRKRAAKHSQTGVMGVSRISLAGDDVFCARITNRHERIYIGSYPTIEQAAQAYLSKKRELHKGNTL